MRWTALLFLAALLCGLAHAQVKEACDVDIEDALREFDAQSPIEGTVVAAHCKPWPPAPNTVVAAVMAFRNAESDGPRQNWDVPAVIALLDVRTRQVIHGRRLTVYEDAGTRLGPDSLQLDVANYAVKPGLRALGLRFHNDAHRPAGADGWWTDELMLLVPEGRVLRSVFCQPLLGQEAVEGSLDYRRPGAVWKTARLTLAVGPQAATGWHDLVATETLALEGAKDATFDPTPHRSRVVFRYDGEHYKLRAKPAPFWSGYRCSFG